MRVLSTSLIGARSAAAALARVVAVSFLTSCGPAATPPPRLTASEAMQFPWDSVTARARSTTVTWRMWRGDPSINAYVDGWLGPRLLERYGITLRTIEGQGAEIVNQLLVERDAKSTGSTDLLWINGETFAQLREAQLLFGPWASRLPSAYAVDSASHIIMRDFQQPLDGYESPWGSVQFALIYDSARTPEPPRTLAELAAWIRTHPGRFTHDQNFNGVTFLKTAMYALHGGPAPFTSGFDSTRYVAASDSLFRWLGALTPAFWRRGTAYPPGVADLHRLFANGEIDFTMSPNQNDVITKIRQGILPSTARALLLRDGTIANAHYVGIPSNAPNAAGAMVVANLLLSAEAQAEKAKPDVWADGTVLDRARLTPADAAFFASTGTDPHAIPADSLAKYARPEVHPTYHAKLAADWKAKIRRGP